MLPAVTRRSFDRILAWLLVGTAVSIFEGIDRDWSTGTILAIGIVFLALVALIVLGRARAGPGRGPAHPPPAVRTPPPPGRDPAGRGRSW
jgi:hypothetical protein